MRRPSTHRSSARVIARVLPGAAPAPFPGFVTPCEPKPRPAPPRGDRWISEIKHDGYRVQAHLEGGRARILEPELKGSARSARYRVPIGDL
jgi:bifunctional non-homologous end joining protein LigD